MSGLLRNFQDRLVHKKSLHKQGHDFSVSLLKLIIFQTKSYQFKKQKLKPLALAALVSSHVGSHVHGTCLISGPCTMYLRQVHTRSGRIWRALHNKEL